jgi:uncharacterized membrane protein YqiK
MVELWIGLVFAAIVVIAILYIISIWVYKRAPANVGFIRTGFLGTKVCLGRGALVLPVFHDVSWISLETIKLVVNRSRDQAVLTSDKIRIDVGTELYTHVGRTEEDLLVASRSLGEKTFDGDKVRNLLEAKVVGAIRSYAATKTLSELHENREQFAANIKDNVFASFKSNGLELEEVTIVTLEQSSREFFKPDNIFDAEGLKIITEITSNARKKVHDTEKRTSVAIRQKDLDTQLELLEIERAEAVAKASQDKEIANEQALQLGAKQTFLLDQRKTVEQHEIANEITLEQMRTKREITVTEEAKKREASDIQKLLVLEQERRDKEIALIEKAKEEELANIRRSLALEKAEKDRQIELIEKQKEEEVAEIERALAREKAEKDKDIELSAKEQLRQEAKIKRETEIHKAEELARDQRHKAGKESDLSMRKRSLDIRMKTLSVDKEEAFAELGHEKEISDEKSRVLSEKQKTILEHRLGVEQEELVKERELESARIKKETAILEEIKVLDSTEVKRKLALELEERDRDIALTKKTGELEKIEIDRLKVASQKEEAQQKVETVRKLAEAERAKEIDRVSAEKAAQSKRIGEKTTAEIAGIHVVSQATSRKEAAEFESKATLIRASAMSDAQKIAAEGIQKEAAARGKAENEIESLRVANTQKMLEAEAAGLEAKAEALKKYNDAATFLELSKLQIEADRDIHVNQAKAMGNALSDAQIRMYGNGEGTMDNIRDMFTKGFAMGEVLDGVAQSLPEGLLSRFAANGIRGVIGRPYSTGEFKEKAEQLNRLVKEHLGTAKKRDIPFPDAIKLLEEKAGKSKADRKALDLLRESNNEGLFDDTSFDKVWSLVQATIKVAE